MDCYITYCICGFIAFDENKKIIDYKLFPKEETITRLMEIENKKVVDEEIAIINEVSNSYNNIYIESNKRSSDYSNFENIQIKTPNKGGEHLRSNLKEILILIGFSNEDNFKEDFTNLYRKLTIYKMKKISQEEDKHLIQGINSIDEIDEGISKLIERIREWYALYFPEMDLIKNNEIYIKLISKNKTKEEIITKKKDIFLVEVDDIEINKEDLEIINEFANSIYNLQIARKNIERYIDTKMDSIAPNLKNLVGASLGAKLIAHAGSVKRLATYPSSTVQIMGAEKALFRHLKTGDKPPKYGLIYQHPQVRSSKWWNRGKIARTLASKISLAVRKDVFSDDIDLRINEDFLEKVNKIEKENPFPSKTTKRRKEEKAKKSSKKRKKRKRK